MSLSDRHPGNVRERCGNPASAIPRHADRRYACGAFLPVTLTINAQVPRASGLSARELGGLARPSRVAADATGLNHTRLLASTSNDVECEVDVFRGVNGGHTRAQSRGVHWHSRVADRNDKQSFGTTESSHF